MSELLKGWQQQSIPKRTPPAYIHGGEVGKIWYEGSSSWARSGRPRVYFLALLHASSLQALYPAGISHRCSVTYYENMLVAAGIWQRLSRPPRKKKDHAPLMNDDGGGDDMQSSDTPGSKDTSDSSDDSSDTSSSSDSSSSSHRSGSSDDGNEEPPPIGGPMSLADRYRQSPDSLNHEWFVFKFTIKRSGDGRYNWQVRCPFHKSTDKALCKRSLQVASELSEDTLHHFDLALRTLKTWAIIAADHDRRWKHRDHPVTPSDALPDCVLNEVCPRVAPEPGAVVPDCLLDGDEGRHSEDSESVGSRESSDGLTLG